MGMILRAYDLTMYWLTALCGMVMFVALSTGIGSRVLTGRSLQWSEETARYAMVYGVAFGAALAYRASSHVGLGFIADFLAGRFSGQLRIVAHCLTIVAGLVLAWTGYTLAAYRGTMETPSLGLPIGYFYWAMPVLGAGLALEALRAIIAPQQEAQPEEPAT